MFQISELALQYAPWSTSKADLAATCPLQFELKHIKKAPEETVHSGNKVGVTAHAILEERTKGKSDAEARRIALLKHPLTSTEQESLITFNEAMESFMKRFDAFCKSQGVTEILAERKWAIRADGTPTRFYTIRDCYGIVKGNKDPEAVAIAQAILDSNPSTADDPFFRGVVDLGLITSSRDMFVIDHKSGVVKDIKYKKKQLDIYAILGRLNHPDIEGFRCGINSLLNPAPTRLQWLPYVDANQVDRALVPWLFQYINESAANLAHERFEARPKKKGWPCAWCPYSLSCRAFQELSK